LISQLKKKNRMIKTRFEEAQTIILLLPIARGSRELEVFSSLTRSRATLFSSLSFWLKAFSFLPRPKTS